MDFNSWRAMNNFSTSSQLSPILVLTCSLLSPYYFYFDIVHFVESLIYTTIISVFFHNTLLFLRHFMLRRKMNEIHRKHRKSLTKLRWRLVHVEIKISIASFLVSAKRLTMLSNTPFFIFHYLFFTYNYCLSSVLHLKWIPKYSKNICFIFHKK